MTLLERRLRWSTMVRSGRAARLRVLVLSTFTADPLVPYLGTALEDRGIPADVRVGPYNQIVQQCLDDDADAGRFEPGALVVWPRIEELWAGKPQPLAADQESYFDDALEMAEVCLEAARRWRATLVWVLPALPRVRPLGAGDAGAVHGVAAIATRLREQLRERLAGQRGVVLADAEDVLCELGRASAYDDRLLAIGHIPFREPFFCAMGDVIATLLRLNEGRAIKAVITDADNTLWGGVVGEDGPETVDLAENGPGHCYRSFQAFLLELRRAGVLLALCTKNDEADVWKVLSRPEMRLKKEHLSAWRIGWSPKSVMVKQIAHELGIGLDSVVLVDDSPVELAEVQAALSEVTCLQMPADPALWPRSLLGAGVLDRLPPTAEDLLRAGHFESEKMRARVFEEATTSEEYRSRLGVVVRIFPPSAADVARLAQLVGKTNQFNINCRRRSEAELDPLRQDPRWLMRLVAARDRFGDYGVVGAYIASVEAGVTDVDTFLLSCRALGRGIEHAMLAHLFEEATRSGSPSVRATVEEQPRNEPARRFFSEHGCAVGVEASVVQPEWPRHVGRDVSS